MKFTLNETIVFIMWLIGSLIILGLGISLPDFRIYFPAIFLLWSFISILLVIYYVGDFIAKDFTKENPKIRLEEVKHEKNPYKLR